MCPTDPTKGTTSGDQPVGDHPSRPRRKNYLPELLLLVVSLVVAAGLGEVLLRIHFVMGYSGTLEDLDTANPPPGTEVKLGHILRLSDNQRLVYMLKPNLEVVFRNTPVRTNAQGWREQELPYTKAPDTIRIVGLGDSIMFGWGVEESQRYMDLLEGLLNENFPAAKWETITLAAPGYNLVTEVEALKEYGLRYDPDLVIYGFANNDLCLPNFVATRKSIWSFDSFIKYYLFSGPSLVDRSAVLLESYKEPGQQRIREDFFASLCDRGNVPPEYHDLVGMDSFLKALRELGAIGRERGIPIVLVKHLYLQTVVGSRQIDGITYFNFARRVRRHLKKKGYDTRLESDLVLSPTDTHPSLLGHWLLANWIYQRLVADGTIERFLSSQGQPDRRPTPAK